MGKPVGFFAWKGGIYTAKFFTTKQEVEVLEEEIQNLHGKLSTCELRLKHRDDTISTQRKQMEKLNDDLSAKDKEISVCQGTSKIFVSKIEFLSNQIQILQSENTQLREQITATPIRPHNERNAGRKHKATSEQVQYILSLFSEGHSQVKIAKILSEQSGDKWNKSTVRNIIISAKI